MGAPVFVLLQDRAITQISMYYSLYTVFVSDLEVQFRERRQRQGPKHKRHVAVFPRTLPSVQSLALANLTFHLLKYICIRNIR